MNAPKASAQKWKLARKFELYWEQTVLVCPYSLIHCFPLVSWCISIIPEIVFFPWLEGMSVTFLLSSPLRHFLSYSCNLLLTFWASALQTALGTECCPPFSCREEGVTCAIPNLPTPLCVNSHLTPSPRPSLVIRLYLSMPFPAVCELWHGYQGGKGKV